MDENKTAIMDLREFLSYFDFDYGIVSPGDKVETRIRQELLEDGDITAEDVHKDLICLIDEQGAYFGDIGKMRYPICQESVEKIIDRMDIYMLRKESRLFLLSNIKEWKEQRIHLSNLRYNLHPNVLLNLNSQHREKNRYWTFAEVMFLTVESASLALSESFLKAGPVHITSVLKETIAPPRGAIGQMLLVEINTGKTE